MAAVISSQEAQSNVPSGQQKALHRRNGMTFSETTIRKPTGIVVMPTKSRPEFLALALERLAAAEKRSIDLVVGIFPDVDAAIGDVSYVRDTYYPDAILCIPGDSKLAPSGCWNILRALKGGYETGSDYIFLIEEDVQIQPDYFQQSLELHTKSEPFAVLGRMIPRYGVDYYTNPGSSFRREMLGLVMPHINDDFFADRRGYLTRTFGPMEEASDLDDGLIRHVHRSTGLPLAFPDKPIAAHQGFHAYNKYSNWMNKGTIQERIARLREMLPTIDPKNRYTSDFESFNP